MALRRLFSGWLIAMAALARSVAQALERASEDRSSPAAGSASDPVMAALAERYPGAPAHWLAHVVERTSQLAETGQAPLSLNSDPTTWPTLRPDAATSGREALGGEPAAPPSRPAPSPREPEVPSLAALRDRSSEVWRRPDFEPRPRPRPVFAPVASERSTRPAAMAATAAPPRRPRSPLTFSAQAETADRPAIPTAPRLSTPTSDMAATASPRQTWPEAPAPRATVEQTPQVDAPPAPKPASEHRFTPASSRAAEPMWPEGASDQARSAPSVSRQRFWFFAKAAPGRLGRALDLSIYPGRGARKVGKAVDEAVDPRPHEAFTYGTSDYQVRSQDRTWRALTPPRLRPSILQALAAIGVRPRSAVAPEWTSEPVVVRPTLEPDHVRSPASRSASRPRPSFPVAEVFSTLEATAPSRSIEEAGDVTTPKSRRPPAFEDPAHDRRPSFTGARSGLSRPSSPRFVDAPSDRRWPGLPPPTFTPPVGVEAPAPRWDQLAREQEKGRWSV